RPFASSTLAAHLAGTSRVLGMVGVVPEAETAFAQGRLRPRARPPGFVPHSVASAQALDNLCLFTDLLMGGDSGPGGPPSRGVLGRCAGYAVGASSSSTSRECPSGQAAGSSALSTRKAFWQALQ